ncbi:hypothetical protein BC943DRAFT_380631 [Umbelopsis sp. AD052]|nr:hypothetical protein BC943DRAFT_380631 [Umbelopsis sp. AD052]
MRVVLLAVAYLMLCDGVTCRSLAHEQSLHRRHELHRKHNHIDNAVDTTTTPSSLIEPSSTNPDPDSTEAYDIIIAQIISQLYSNYTSGITPLDETAQPDTLTFENSTLVSELANSTQTHTKTSSHQHTPHNTAAHRPAKHAVQQHSATNTISKLAEQETDRPDKQSAHKSHKPPDTEKDNDDNDDDDDEDDDDDDGNDNGSNMAVAHMVTPSATMSARPSVTAYLESPTNTQAESEAVRAERANKIIGIVVGLGCVVIGAAGLAGIIIIRKREKARQIVLDDQDVQTRWRPQSFLAVVTTAVTRAQQSCHRENSIKSNGSSESKYGQRPQSPIAV